MRPIDADILVEEFEWLLSVEYDYQKERTEDAIQRIKNAKTLTDLEPVKHGKWIWSKDETLMSPGYEPCYECSECGRKINTWSNPVESAPYCHCGAKMKHE